MTNRSRLIGNEIAGPSNRSVKSSPKSIATVVNPIDPKEQINKVLSTIPRPNPKDVWPNRITAWTGEVAAKIPFFNYFAFDLLFVVILGVVASASSLINWAFLLYLFVALFLRISSERMFSSALISLVIIPVAIIANRSVIADNFAVMTYYFLAIGTIRAILEYRKSSTV